ncbi:MAG TPA: hypothetical protein PK280_03270 [Planctomycetota bacterium]|nr:hypothetical protein [Planctomycetota bacterium]
MELILVVIGFIVLVVVIRLLAGSLDGGRIESYVKENGWELIDRSWDPLGPGWFGEKDSRIYQVVYKDRQGNVHRAHVKTSMLSGVYFTNDEIVQRAPAPEGGRGESLAEENARLKARIKELEDGRG